MSLPDDGRSAKEDQGEKCQIFIAKSLSLLIRWMRSSNYKSESKNYEKKKRKRLASSYTASHLLPKEKDKLLSHSHHDV